MNRPHFFMAKITGRAMLPYAAPALALAFGIGLAGCDSRVKMAAAPLVRVNGDAITLAQLDGEIGGSGQAVDEAERKQVLESLIDRQLLRNEAVRAKLEDDPSVAQAIESATSQILARAYLQRRVDAVARPSAVEVEAYFQAHPAFFADRKMFELDQLVFSAANFGEEFKQVIDSAKSLEDAAAWLDGHRVLYTRHRLSRSSADFSPELEKKMRGMQKGQLFVVREGDRAIVMAIAAVRSSPLAIDAARADIERYLVRQKRRELANGELARLRAIAKVEYSSDFAPRLAAARNPAVEMQSADISKESGTSSILFK